MFFLILLWLTINTVECLCLTGPETNSRDYADTGDSVAKK